MKIYENAVIGGGASGLMFAASLKDKSGTVILEKNPQLGAKILISGGGKCNFTNKNIFYKDYLGDKKFINTTIKKLNSKWLLNWFTSRGLQYSIKNGTEYFCKNSSKEILEILKREINGVGLKLNCEILGIGKEGNIFKIFTKQGAILAKRAVVASGGLSFPKLGASSIGFDIAKSFGHKIVPASPALVGWTLQKEQSFFKSLSGISVDAKICVQNREFKAPILFAHKGISGPAVLNASLFWSKGFVEIDFLPNFDLDLIRGSKRSVSNELPLPKRFSRAFLEHINLQDKPCSRLKGEEFKKLSLFKSYKFAPAGTFGYSKAEVTKGGICTDEIDSKTLMSKKEENLYFLGEVLNVTGRLGGYNLHWAFTSGVKCAAEVTKS